MALIHAHFFSKTLFLNVSVEVILPQDENKTLAAGPLPTLWLLHGEGGDHTSWQRNTAIERYASERGIAVVMPAGENGLWTNMKLGFHWFDFVSNELPETMTRFFPLSSLREDNAVAGVGSGGYGALKLALSSPYRYRAAAAFSGGNLIAGPAPCAPPSARETESMRKLAYACFGVEGAATIYDLPSVMGGIDDPFALARELVASKKPAPSLFLANGGNDPLAANCRRTKDFFTSFQGDPFRLDAREAPGRGEWALIDRWLSAFLDREFAPAGQGAAEYDTAKEKP